jgi:hypothetical protein
VTAGTPGVGTSSGAHLPAAIDTALSVTWAGAERDAFAGWDPYDGLNGRLFRATPFFKVPLARQAWIQLIKRSPVNLRPLTLQQKEVLAKGVALFALGAWRLADQAGSSGGSSSGSTAMIGTAAGADAATWRARGTRLLDHLMTLRSPGFPEPCWGYPYDWQSRAFFQPRNAPNLICSVFAAMAFERRTDGGDATTVPDGVADFIRRVLIRRSGPHTWVTYTPTTNTQVHNVNMLGAALLARSAKRRNDAELAELARATMKFSVDHLDPDGSWPYGEAPNQAWIDNFHTGYNLVALEDYRKTTGETWMDDALGAAYRYWDRTFFKPDGAPSYYHDSHWPIDIHCSAQAILTWLDLARLDPEARAKAAKTTAWTLRHLWDGTDFTFQKGPWWVNEVPQIRWGQAWMFWALGEMAACCHGAPSPVPSGHPLHVPTR